MISTIVSVLLLLGGLSIVPTNVKELPSRDGWGCDTANSSELCSSFRGFKEESGDTTSFSWCLSKHEIAFVCVKQRFIRTKLSDVWLAYTVKDSPEIQDYLREQYYELYGEWGRFYLATEDGWNYYKQDSVLAMVMLEDSDSVTTMLVLWSNLSVTD